MKQRQRRNINVPNGYYYTFDAQGNVLAISAKKEDAEKKAREELKKGESPIQQNKK